MNDEGQIEMVIATVWHNANKKGLEVAGPSAKEKQKRTVGGGQGGE